MESLRLFWIAVSVVFAVGQAQVLPVTNPEIYRLHIVSDISFRFATTNVTSYIANNADTAVEAVFKVTLPPQAFISNFSMVIDGKLYNGDVKEKAAAQRQYDRAKKKGHSAGQVKVKSPKEANKFRIEINVAAQSKVEFSLTYQELLKRKLGIYEHVINIDPGQVVRDLNVKVSIQEARKILLLKVPELRTEYQNSIEVTENPLAVVERLNNHNALVTYAPDVAAQLESSTDGIAGEFIVQYDVERELSGGELMVVDGYFVHYFAPNGLNPVAKDVMFILDTSGSMSGTKMQQVKEAMTTILDDLREGDKFNILSFSYGVKYWNKDDMVPVDTNSIAEAKVFIGQMSATGGTNIHDALIKGAEFLGKQREVHTESRPTIMIFLTDGQPSSGIINKIKIMENFRHKNQGSSSLFTLGFGNDVDFDFLTKVSLQNDGFARKIYVDADATLQLQNFYEEVSTPLLAGVKITYLDETVDPNTVTDTSFSSYFQGSEIIVAGKLKNDKVSNLISQVSGHASTGYMEMDLEASVARMESKFRRHDYPRFTEKLWAYLTIKKLLDTMVRAVDANVTQNAKQRALALSLKYGFVTPLTSMVVTKPEDKEDPKEVPEESLEQKPAKDVPVKKKPRQSQQNGPKHSSVQKKTQQSPRRRAHSFVDNDPHFVVHVRGMEQSICFDVNGQPGDVFQLLYDNINDIVINGEVNAPDLQPPNMNHIPTYFTHIAVIHSGIRIQVAPRKIKINNTTMPWKASDGHKIQDITIKLKSKHQLAIKIGKNIEFLVLRHLSNVPNPRKMDYLGFYVSKGEGLDQFCHGLLGQFENGNVHMEKAIAEEVKNIKLDQTKPKVIKTLKFQASDGSKRSVMAFLGQRRNMELKQHVPCWHIRNNGRGLLQGHFMDYSVPHLYHVDFALYSNRLKNTVKKAGVSLKR